MGAQLGGAGAFADINMTPLIDIVLVVLIIMMVNIPIQIEEMGIKLPSNLEVQPKDEPPADQLVVAIYEDGTVALNRRLMNEEVMFYEVTRRLRPLTEKAVFIDAFPTTPYGRVVDMMDMAREAGAEKVALARLKPSGPAPATSVDAGAMPRGVTLGSPSVVGALTEKQADEQFQPAMSRVRACFDQALATAPTTSGRFIARVAVGPDGEIMESGIISSTVENEALETCVGELLPALRYKPLGPQNTALVHYPLLFSPG